MTLIAAAMASGCSRQETGWRDAAEADSVAAYEEYLTRYPAGPHAAQARARIRELREEQDWARAERLRTPEAWQRYLAAWPDGRHAGEAHDRLAQFVPETAAAGWSVQLGAFASERTAQAARARLAEAHVAELGGMALLVLAPQDEPAGWWRLRAGPLPEAAARALCARLRQSGADCVPVPN